MYCSACGYALHGLKERRCPECGRPFDPHDDRTFSTQPPSLSQHAPLLGGVAGLLLAVLAGVIGGLIGWNWAGCIVCCAPPGGFVLGYWIADRIRAGRWNDPAVPPPSDDSTTG
jgi:hypothetical protein